MLLKKNKGQIWVETAIYTLIGLTIIAILLSAATPQITKIKDRGIVEQTMEALNLLDSKIVEVEQSAGNIRIVNLRVAKGKLEIDAQNNVIQYVLEDTRLKLSEPGEEVEEGNLLLRTSEYGSKFNIALISNYSNRLNLTHDMTEQVRVLHAGTTPYKIQIENVGDNAPGQPTHIRLSII